MTSVNDDLSKVIAESLNKMSKESQIAYFIGQEETPTDLTDFVSTGSSLLDLAISNRPNGGLPVGRIAELTGLEGSGKSLVAAHLLMETQKRDGVAVLIDTENAVNAEFFQSFGLDMSKLVYAPVSTVEEIFSIIEKIIESVRKGNKDKLVTIVVDSVAGASTEVEMAADYTKDGWATTKAIIIGKALRKITTMIGRQKVLLVFTNQLRQKLNAMAFADPWTTSGGKALAFHSSVRIRLSIKGKLKNKDGLIVGVSIKAQVTKNRVGPPYRTAEFNIYFDRGIDDLSTWLDVMKKNEITKQAGAYVKYTSDDKKEHQFQTSKFAKWLEDNPEYAAEIYGKICNSVIMSYKVNGENDRSEIEFEEGGLPDSE